MTALIVWKLVAALATTPSVVIVARAIARRLSSAWKAKVSETDYLRAEAKREREEKMQALRDAKAEHKAEIAEQEAEAARRAAEHEVETARLRHIIDARDNEVDALHAALKEAKHDLTTARLFVDGATTTRRDKR